MFQAFICALEELFHLDIAQEERESWQAFFHMISRLMMGTRSGAKVEVSELLDFEQVEALIELQESETHTADEVDGSELRRQLTEENSRRALLAEYA